MPTCENVVSVASEHTGHGRPLSPSDTRLPVLTERSRHQLEVERLRGSTSLRQTNASGHMVYTHPHPDKPPPSGLLMFGRPLVVVPVGPSTCVWDLLSLSSILPLSATSALRTPPILVQETPTVETWESAEEAMVLVRRGVGLALQFRKNYGDRWMDALHSLFLLLNLFWSFLLTDGLAYFSTPVYRTREDIPVSLAS